MAHPKRALVCLASGAASLACLASAPLRAETAADPRLGAEVKRACFASQLDRFQSVKGEDNVIVFERGAGEFFRVEVSGDCTESEINHAGALALAADAGDSCLSRGDRLVLSRSAFFQDQRTERTYCIVERIFKWYPKAKAADDKAAPAPSKSE